MLLKLSLSTKSSHLAESNKPIKVRVVNEKRFKEKKQIVQSEDSENKEKKDDAFLSDKDRSFDRQTKARKIDKFKQASKGKSASKRPKKDMKLSDLAAFAPGTDPYKDVSKKPSDKKNGRPESDRQAEEDVSSTNDHVENLPLGDLTHLNTAEYKFYGFYHRIRQQLEQFWGASIQDKATDMAKDGRQLSSDDELITSLQITLDKEGKIVSIRLMGSSGVRELDDAAIEAFNDAGPFPNPPRELVKNGRVTLEWGFVIKT